LSKISYKLGLNCLHPTPSAAQFGTCGSAFSLGREDGCSFVVCVLQAQKKSNSVIKKSDIAIFLAHPVPFMYSVTLLFD
jgi:hypothetical protein